MVDTKDFARLVLDATAQIPMGMVSTYGDIANALGDVASSRTVGKILAWNPRPIVVPCHRVVYSNGEVGWYSGKGKGNERKTELLTKEGVRIEDGKVQDFDAVRFSDFKVEPMLKELREEQEVLRRRVIEDDRFGELRYVAGVDVSYADDDAFAAMVVYDWTKNRIVERMTMKGKADFPYIPSYLAFREIPVIADLIKDRKDTIFLIDGQGVLHPRGLGIASHIGVALDVPTIGVAKSLLSGTVEDDRLGESPIRLDDLKRGYFLRGPGRHPLYVSVGHRVSLGSAVDVCRRFLVEKGPDPMREAHRLANSTRKSALGPGEGKE